MDRQTYLDLIVPAIEIVAKKHEDYNDGVVLDQYFPFADFSYVQMLHVKTLRLVSLADKQTQNFESKKDTLYDLINYAVFYLQHLEKQEAVK